MPAGTHRLADSLEVKFDNIFGFKSDLLFRLKSSQADWIALERNASGFVADFKSWKDHVALTFEVELRSATFLALGVKMAGTRRAPGVGVATCVRALGDYFKAQDTMPSRQCTLPDHIANFGRQPWKWMEGHQRLGHVILAGENDLSAAGRRRLSISEIGRHDVEGADAVELIRYCASRGWALRFLKHRIADKRILRLVAKWLRVGVVETGRVMRSERGAPQGAVISPILANIYLHYVFDLWVHQWRRRKATGDVIVVRFADDTIVGFEHEHEAQAFLHDLQERMGLFDLALHLDKTRLIRFGRHAAEQRAACGEGKPEVFDFLGFTHYCTRSRKWGSFVIGRKTIKKRMLRSLEAIKIELRKRMHEKIVETGAWVWQMLNGHLNYFAVPGNDKSLWWFWNELRWRWLKTLRRRSQTARLDWDRFVRITNRFFPPIRVRHPMPCHRFDATIRGKSPVR